jgi:hypothetical protein
MSLHVFVFFTEFLSSNKKYGAKQRQYKLFAGKFGYFDTDQARICSQAFLRFGFALGWINGDGKWV